MRSSWIILLGLVLLMQAATAQTPVASARVSTPASSAAAASTPPIAAASSSPLPYASSDIAALRQDIESILRTTQKIARTQEEEGSLLLKVRDGFITNALWELFGFKQTEKTIAGYAISFLGILGLVLKAVWFISKSGEPEPTWARVLTYAYLVVVVSVFSLLAFSGGVASEVPASSSAAKPLLEAAARLESTVDNRLRGIDERVAVLAAARPGSIPTGTAELTASISALRLDLQAIHSTSEAAATQSAKAANKSTGWGWHLVIVVLLLGVLLVLFAALERK